MNDLPNRSRTGVPPAGGSDRFLAMAQTTKDAIISADERGNIIFVNRAAGLMFDYLEGELLGQPLTLLMPERFSNLHEAGMERFQNTGVPKVMGQTVELYGQRKDGHEFPIELSLSTWKEGTQSFYIAILREISGRKAVEKELQRLKEFNEGIVQSVVEGIIIVGLDGIISFINPAAAAMTGYEPGELAGQHWKMIVPPEHQQLVEAANERRARGSADRYELELSHKDGSRIPVMVSGVPHYVDDKFAGSLAVFVDLSELKRSEVELLKLSKAVEASGDAIFMTDRDGLITYVNPGFTRLYGYSAEEVVGQVTPRILKSGRMAPQDYTDFWETLLSKQVVRGEFINLKKNGEYIYVAGSANPILDVQGNIIGYLAIQRDITARVRMEEAERAARELAEQRASELAVLERIAETLNRATTLGDSLEPALATVMELVGANSSWIVLMEPGDGSNLAAASGPLVEAEKDDYVSIPLRVGGKALGHLNMVLAQNRDFDEEELRLLTTVGDQFGVAIERARLFDEVQQLAITDPLTGLYNRRHLFALAEREFERARRYASPLAVIMMDLDYFKRVNDTYGHVIGDQVLRVVAERCQKSLREVDVLGRYGGEEFVVILPETIIENARQVAGRLSQHVGGTAVETEKGPVSVTMSLGVAPLDEHCPDFDALVERADMVLYAAKQAGRNQVAVWKETR